MMNFVTIGAFGFSEAGFFEALTGAGVDTFCDLRWRRGVRGSEYKFVNSARLQRRLAELQIHYLHFRDLAPAPDLRQRQAELDKAQGIAKRARTSLGKDFIHGYEQSTLAAFDSRQFLKRLGASARTVALFCVEREPAACHRSLLAQRLQQDLGISIVHLLPQAPP
jgi:hypothetical protein